jgi:hypothetical protein
VGERAFSSAGRAPRLHRGCRRFDPGRAHHQKPRSGGTGLWAASCGPPAVGPACDLGAAGEWPVADPRRSPRSTRCGDPETRPECRHRTLGGRTGSASEEGPSADLSAETPAMRGFVGAATAVCGVRMPSPRCDEQRTTCVRQRLLEAAVRGRIAERSGAGPPTGTPGNASHGQPC